MTMQAPLAMSVEKLSKSFDVPSYQVAPSRFASKRRAKRTLDILIDVNANFYSGEVALIVGDSGAGKTTLLKVLCDILTPDSGHVYHFGRTTRMLDHGVLLAGDYTFEENVIRSRDFLGIERSDCVRVAGEIVEKANTQDVSDLPLQYCSQQVRTRLTCLLGFYSAADLLLIDNQFPFGDVEFEKCYWNEMEQFRERGKSVVLAARTEYGLTIEPNRSYSMTNGTLIEV